jgi:hypothetical protein
MAYRLFKTSDAKDVILDVCRQKGVELRKYRALSERLRNEQWPCGSSTGCKTCPLKLADVLKKGKPQFLLSLRKYLINDLDSYSSRAYKTFCLIDPCCRKTEYNYSAEVIDPIKDPVSYVAGFLKVGASSIYKWKNELWSKGSLDRSPGSGRPSKSFPTWAHVSIRNIIIGVNLFIFKTSK